MPYLHDRARHHRLPTFKPHGGPITHSSTGSKPDSPVHPRFPKLFPTLDFVCNSRVTFLMLYSGIRHNTYSHCFEPLFTPCSRHRTIACLLETSHDTSLLCSRYFVSFNSRVNSATFLDITDQIVDLEEVCSPGVPTLYSFVSTMEFLKEGRRLHHDDLKQRNEDIHVLDRPL